MTEEEKYRILSEHIKFSAERSKIAVSMMKPLSEAEKKVYELQYQQLNKQINANLYRGTEAHKEELEFLKTAPKRSLGICSRCAYFTALVNMLNPNEKLKNAYCCEKHSKAVVEERLTLKKWVKTPIPKDCPYFVEANMSEWNNGGSYENQS